jgi:putative glycosyltransferase (TIGR04372 family)
MTLRRLRLRLSYAVNRARDEGLSWTARELALRGGLWLAWLCLIPVTLPLHAAGYRRLPILTQRIGHLAAEVDCFLKKMHLNQIDTAGKRYFILAPQGKLANPCLMDYWREHITVVSHPVACWLLGLMSRSVLMRHDIHNYLLAIGGAADYYSVEAQWAERPVLLKLRSEHRRLGQRFLRDMGMPEGAWFVCVHARDGGYSTQDESTHDYRNMSVENLLPAMQEIVARGGWCIRMGDVTSQPLGPMINVVDYAHHPARSAELDIFLCASCRFFLGNTSGLFLVSSIFGVPSALTNQTPFVSTGFRLGDLSIPKRIKRMGQSEFMTSEEILRSPIASYRMSRFYVDAQVELIENSAEEIHELAQEMLDTLDGRFQEEPDVALCRARFTKNLTPEHYCFGAAGKIAATFLLRHREMFLKPVPT